MLLLVYLLLVAEAVADRFALLVGAHAIRAVEQHEADCMDLGTTRTGSLQ